MFRKLILAVVATLPTIALGQTAFDTFTPIAASVPAGTLPEATPFVLGNSSWSQVTIADRTNQLALGQSNSGNWDMQTANETGPDAGRYLYTPYETGAAGVQRIDLLDPNYNTRTKTIVDNGAKGFVVGDASRWTPWGSYLTAEESWGTNSTKGRLFEITNPTTATGMTSAGAGVGADPTNFVHRNTVARVSHEGLGFDAAKSMYYIDELNGGSIFKFTSNNPNATSGNDYFASGVNSVLRVGDGNTDNAVGAFTWVPFTDANGVVLAGGVTTDGSADARATTDLAAYKGTNYQRPEDMDIQVVNGVERMYIATTTTNEVYAMNLATNQMNVFVNRNTINAATGLPVGNELTSPDNIAIDAEGNMYIIEDQPGGAADIWFATDTDRNGVAESIARWATMSTAGAEPTGLYFDVFNPNVAYVNIQHPSSGNDRTIMITVPEPTTLTALAGLATIALRRRAR